jgi:hypothetical protein
MLVRARVPPDGVLLGGVPAAVWYFARWCSTPGARLSWRLNHSRTADALLLRLPPSHTRACRLATLHTPTRAAPHPGQPRQRHNHSRVTTRHGCPPPLPGSRSRPPRRPAGGRASSARAQAPAAGAAGWRGCHRGGARAVRRCGTCRSSGARRRRRDVGRHPWAPKARPNWRRQGWRLLQVHVCVCARARACVCACACADGAVLWPLR